MRKKKIKLKTKSELVTSSDKYVRINIGKLVFSGNFKTKKAATRSANFDAANFKFNFSKTF